MSTAAPKKSAIVAKLPRNRSRTRQNNLAHAAEGQQRLELALPTHVSGEAMWLELGKAGAPAKYGAVTTSVQCVKLHFSSRNMPDRLSLRKKERVRYES